MDAIHDLGGKQGFGPIDTAEPDEPFHHGWEARMWAIARTSHAPDWTIDWWRHSRERIMPEDYLTRPYFDQWAQNYLACFINSGIFTLDDVVAGTANDSKSPAVVFSLEQVLAASRDQCRNFSVSIPDEPRFTPGDTIVTRRDITAAHTRLPQYARGRGGTIRAHHGAHVFADASAAGVEEGQHIYSVTFLAVDLWPEASDRRDEVILDLWESYLEPA